MKSVLFAVAWLQKLFVDNCVSGLQTMYFILYTVPLHLDYALKE